MLVELRVRDLAVIADVTLPLTPGLNVLTGETGAGKSMLVDALALLLGERASSEIVRPGAQKTVIEGAFEFTPTALSRLLPPFTALGVEVEEGRLVLKREISGEGRSRAWVNGSPTTVGVLAQLGALLVDLHGQHETQSLLKPDAQRDILDAFADAAVERTAVRDAYERFRELERRAEALAAQREEVRRKADYLRHVVDEIARAAPQLGEVETLATEAQRLAHADELGRLSRELEQALDTAGLARAAKLVAGLERLDPSVATWQALLDGAFANVEELAQAARELELLDTADLDLRAIAEQRATAAAAFTRACAALTGKRTQGAERLAGAVNELLPALGMPGGRVVADLSPLPSPRGDGAEGVVFQVQLNVGLDARPLARLASGGELSRIMLALKVVLTQHDAVPALVFDEVDQGIGGEVGGRVGEALAVVAQGGRGGARHQRQALVIPHLPQIAAYADHHLVVAKAATRGVATSDVQVVAGDARVRELARMLGDADMGTAVRHAEELLRKTSAKPETRSDTPSRPARPPRR